MNRRSFLQSAGAACAGLAFTKSIPIFADTVTNDWRTFEVTSKVEVLSPKGVTHIWLPTALIRDTPYQRTLSNKFTADGGKAELTKDVANALGIVSASFPVDAKPVLTLTSRVSVKNYGVDLATPPKVRPRASKERTELLPSAQQVCADGRHREGHCSESHGWRDRRYRQGARDLRVERGEHIP